MNGIHLHTGNRLEALAEQLQSVLAEPLDNPFTPEVILVQSLGMSRWISLQLAKGLGICMNCEFPFPRAFLGNTLRSLFPQLVPDVTFSPDLLTWKIHHLLPTVLNRPEYLSVRNYLADGDSLKVYQLASRLAQLFDHYLAYRPEMLLDWEAGREALDNPLAAWQAHLWRSLNPNRDFHFAAALQALRQHGIPPEKRDELPQRLSVFGISSLPPAQLEILYHLAKERPVHLFLLSPSKEYFGDDLTPKERARRRVEIETGNPLLTSLGRLNAHFTELNLEIDERVGASIHYPSESFFPPEDGTLLHQIQEDILNAAPATPIAVQKEDDSIQIHSCHSPTREIEILYNQLLGMLEADPSLSPREILVMAPDIEKYAPLIQAIFGNPENPDLRIPFSVADRHARSESLTIDTFLRLIDLPISRCTSTEVFAILETPIFRSRFSFSEEDLEQIREWISQSGIRWGLNAKHRASLGLPEIEETTWQHGMERLLLGYAMTGANQTFFDRVLPFDDVEGNSASLLGRLCAAIEAITLSVEEIQIARPLAEWPAVLGAIIDRFFTSTRPGAEESPTVRELRETLPFLKSMAEGSAPDQIVSYEVMRQAMAQRFSAAEGEGRFLTGGVTFCALKPMRSVPAKVIWLLGMDDGLFPRTQNALQFDLTAKAWKLGDRSVKNDDRYLFLEALVSARQRLCISYLGRSPKDNSEVPPSVIVTEFLEYLKGAADTSLSPIFYPHRLHAYSDYYFSPSKGNLEHRLWSFSRANATASNAVRNRGEERPFFTTSLPESKEESSTILLDHLVALLQNPASFFLKHRLGISLREEASILLDDETAPIDHLASYHLKNERLRSRLSRKPLADPSTYAARGILPSGSMTAPTLLRIDDQTERFYARISSLLSARGPKQEPLSIDISIEETRIVGTLNSIYGESCVAFRPASTKEKDLMTLWVQYLAHRVAYPNASNPALLIGEGGAYEFAISPEEARTALAKLVDLYFQALRAPLPFFPKSSMAYAESLLDGEGTEKALEAASKKWNSGYEYSGELEDPAINLCFNADTAPPPFGEAFQQISTTIYEPLLGAKTTLK